MSTNSKSDSAASGKMVPMTLAQNSNYGKAIRKGESGKVYEFQVGVKTLVLESDIKGFKDREGPQYTAHLIKWTN